MWCRMQHRGSFMESLLHHVILLQVKLTNQAFYSRLKNVHVKFMQHSSVYLRPIWLFASTEHHRESILLNVMKFPMQNHLLRSMRFSILCWNVCEAFKRKLKIYQNQMDRRNHTALCLPLVIASSAQPAPVAPPPMMITSYSSPL